jgi:hypothetical protein
MSNSPYKGIPFHQHFGRLTPTLNIADIRLPALNPFVISKSTKIASLGSCFAQHIAQYLITNEYRYDFFEHPEHNEALENLETFRQFSARYGNIYTPKQDLDLTLEALGRKEIRKVPWEWKGKWIDALRPGVFNTGAESVDQVFESRASHLTAVKKILLETDVFVFTLGLTESWVHTPTDSALPMAPGVRGGHFDSKIYHFENFSFFDTYAAMVDLIKTIRSVNPGSKFIVTVSPVPLQATYENNNVIAASIQSKSVLRSVAGEILKTFTDVSYFPSYELITNHLNQGRYFAENLRDINSSGVKLVMRNFEQNYNPRVSHQSSTSELNLNRQLSKVICDEDFIL